MKPYKIRELVEAIRSLKPYTVKYPKEPSPPPPGFRGRPQFNEKCIGCGACAEVCPAKAISVVDEGNVRRIEVAYGSCIFCGQCAENCPTKGITLSEEYSNVYTSLSDARTSVERELVRCEVCGNAIATIDHLRWIIDRLGTKAFSNTTLIRVVCGASREEVEKLRDQLTRGDELRILCEECKRRVKAVDHGWRVKY